MKPIELFSQIAFICLISVFFTGCNKPIAFLHSNKPLQYSRVNEYPIVLYNGYGGREVVMDRENLFDGADSITTNNADYLVVGYRLTIIEQGTTNKKLVYDIKGNKFTPEVKQYLFGGHTCKFTISHLKIFDKWGRPTKSAYKETTYFILR